MTGRSERAPAPTDVDMHACMHARILTYHVHAGMPHTSTLRRTMAVGLTCTSLHGQVVAAAEVESLRNGGAVILHFWAEWAPMCTQTKELTTRLAGECPNVRFANVEAEEAEDLAEAYSVESVPAFVFLPKGAGSPEVLVGANAPEVSKKAMALNSGGGVVAPAAAPAVASEAATAPPGDLKERLKQLVNKEPVMLFMKGSPGAEKCGFSRTITTLLKEQGVAYGFFDILTDESVRQGLKEYSKWPTYPQLYAHGELIGGLDIIKELIEGGELLEALGQSSSKEPLNTRLEKLIGSAPVMLFMKGQPAAAKCGFSRTIVELLSQNGIEFGSFDILTDEEVCAVAVHACMHAHANARRGACSGWGLGTHAHCTHRCVRASKNFPSGPRTRRSHAHPR